ncbi:hypothetical protein [uncultured Roseovarius sp.]|uniref:hypothetical protein n=1 Tax=uncultured Roseovarius sp. TaxID=293344 RepID=UPI002612C171|nr:hypothetical protein [uncultured Roseovarius sp.]
MFILFGDIKASDPKSYIADKIARFTPEDILEEVSETLAKGHGGTLPLAAEADIPELSGALQRQVDARKTCALDHLEEEAQLAAGETVEHELFTYLTADHGAYPSGTPILHRVTNMAELFYAFPNLVVDAQAVALSEVPIQDPAPCQAVAVGLQSGPDPVSDLAKQLGIALLEKLGAMAFGAVFPPQPPSYFQQVYAELKKIVRQELTEQNIALISGAVNGTGTWFKYEYVEIKEGGEKPAELLRLLRTQSMDLHRQISTLLEEKFRMPGLQVFLVAGAVHLALRQEMQIVKRDNPGQEAELTEEEKTYAQRYAQNVVDTFNKIVSTRCQMVKIKTKVLTQDYPAVVKYGYYWEDTYTGQKSEIYWDMIVKSKDVPGKPQAKADRKRHNTALRAQLSLDLGEPEKVAQAWRDSEIIL